MVWWLKKRQLVHPSAGSVCNEFCLVLGLKVRYTRRGFCTFCNFIGYKHVSPESLRCVTLIQKIVQSCGQVLYKTYM